MSGFEWSIVSVEVTIGELKKKQKKPPTRTADVAAGASSVGGSRKRPRTETGPPPRGGDVEQRGRKKKTVATTKKSRHMEWRAGQSYELIREGRPVTEDQIDALTDSERLAEDMFFIFKHRDTYMDRNTDIPQYEAVFLCSPTGTKDPSAAWKRDKVALVDGQLPENYRYIRTQKRHLDQAYTKSERKDRKRMWDLMEDGTPYWVCRYAFRIKNERAVKQRHEEKKRRLRQAQRQEKNETVE